MRRSTGTKILFLSALLDCSSSTTDNACRNNGQTCAPDELRDCETGACYREPCTEGNFRPLDSQGAVSLDVWGSAPNDVWMVGNGGMIRRWDGNGLVALTSGTTSNLSSVWGLDSKNIWVGADDGSDANHVWAVSSDSGQVSYWNGVTWTLQDTGTKRGLYAVWGSDSRNVWASGSTGKIVHWDGDRWSSICSGSLSTLRHIWVGSANDVWILDNAGQILRNGR